MAIFLFFDESGNLDFSAGGTKYYAFGCLTTRDPAALLHPLSALRYELLAGGTEIEAFHATEDRQAVRDRVFSVIAGVGEFDFDAVLIEKRKANPILHAPERFYPKFAGYLLRHVFKRYSGNEKIIIVTDRLPIKRHREAVEKAFKTFLRTELMDREFTIVHHNTAAHLCLQAADYCMWAIYKKWSTGDLRSYEIIRPFVKSEFDIFRVGTDYFY